MRLRSRFFRRQSGIALVIVLGLIVFLALILVAFVSQTRVETTASASFSQAVSADNLALDSVHNVIGQFQGEIEAGSTNTVAGGVTIYRPKALTDSFPKPDGSIPVSATISSLPNLLRTSRPGALYASTNSVPPNSFASSVSTDKPSMEGLSVSIDRWNAPHFLTPTQNISSEIPKWIYVDRSGAKALTSWSAGLSQPYSGGSVNSSFVVGRYAYRVYDTSGLIDVNVAGYPGKALDPASKPRIGRKGGLPWANLAEAGFSGWPGVDAGLTLHFPSWRGPKAGHDDYVDGKGIYQGNGGNETGFLRSVSGADAVNRFLNRSDLLGFLKSTSNQFSDGGDIFAPQVTVFSRETNTSAWGPDRTVADSPAAVNPFLPAILTTGSFTRRNGKEAKAGEPLLKTRFPLSKIELLSNPVGNKAEIIKYFGLTKDAADGSGPWRYVHGRKQDSTFGDGPRERLKTLSEVANRTDGDNNESDTQTREPNFFELLQAGILADSLGLAVSTSANFTLQSSFYDKNIARHVLQIGANIIDQYDADDDPTWIQRTDFENLVGAILQPDPDISGVENLPYVHLLTWLVLRDKSRDGHPSSNPTESGVTIYPWVISYYGFQLWNPHQNAAQAKSNIFRIIASGRPQVRTSGNGLGTGNLSVYKTTAMPLTPAASWLQFQSNPAEASANFSEPHFITAADSAPAASGGLSLVNSQPHDQYSFGGAQVAGFKIGEMKMDYTSQGGTENTSHVNEYEQDDGPGGVPANQAKFTLSQTDGVLNGNAVSFQLQKWSTVHNEWIPVQTLANLNRATGSYLTSYILNDLATTYNRPFVRRHWLITDPRSPRFGPMFGNGDKLADTAAKFVNGGFRPLVSDIPTVAHPALYGLEWLPSNAGQSGFRGPTVTNDAEPTKLFSNLSTQSMYYKNRGAGATVPMGDAPASNPLDANNSTAMAGRSIILNRPFLNITEISFAGRDLPWRTLNFSQELPTAPSEPRMRSTDDSALLDLFTIQEEPAVRAGVINLNTASVEALTALLLNTNIFSGTYGSATAEIPSTEVPQVAKAIFDYLGGGKRAKTNALPIIQTAADIPRMIQDMSLQNLAFQGWSKMKKEAVVAALAKAHNGRTWNLAIDVIAQTGRFPSGTSTGSLEKFQVTGSKRLLVHVALDRYTGEVVDQLVEPVIE